MQPEPGPVRRVLDGSAADGQALPYHWGRYRGLAQDMGLTPLNEGILRNVYFDTCVYHQAGIDVLTKVVPHRNILFGSEMIGAVKGIDPETGYHFDDTKRYILATPNLTDSERHDVFAVNHLKVYPRLKAALAPDEGSSTWIWVSPEEPQ